MIKFWPVASRRLVASQLVWFFVWLAVTSFGIYLSAKPDGHGTHTELGLPPCPSVAVFGRPCPGCGLTTSFTATIHGNFALAFHAHPLGPVLYLLLTVSAWVCLWAWWNRKYIDLTSASFRRLTAGALTVFLLFGAARFILSPHYGDNDAYHLAFVAANHASKGRG